MINRRYDIAGKIGGGGSGDVFLVHDTLRDKEIALKIFSSTREIDEVIVRQEFDFLSGFTHPGLIRVFEFGKVHESDDPSFVERYFYTMERLRGSDALEYFAGIPFSLEKVALLEHAFIQALAALDYIHREGVIHYDIKPQNIFITSSGPGPLHIKLVDFGFSAKTIDSSGAPPLRGTLEYMAPEILQGRPFDPRVDLYSLGMTFRHLWSGQPSLKGATPMELIRSIINEDAPPLDRSGAGGSVLPELIERLARRNPGERWGSAREVLIQLASTGHETAVRKALASLVGELFVGRKLELASIEEAARLSVQPDGPRSTIIVIEGVQGSGKSALLDQVENRLTRTSLPVVVARPAPSGASFEDEIRKMSSINPEECPFVLLIDDGDRGEEEPGEILARVRSCTGQRRNLLIVLTASDDAETTWEGLERGRVVRIVLDELSKEDVRSLFHRIMTENGVPVSLLDSFYASYGGNPQVVSEALRAVIGGVPLARDRDGGKVGNVEHVIDKILTRTLDQFFLTRYSGLRREKQLILQVLSCVEHTMDVALLKAIVPFQDEHVNVLLRSLERGRYGQSSEDRKQYSIRHTSLQRGIYAALGQEERESLHRFIAACFEKTAGTNDREGMKELARQFQGSGDWEKAALYYEKAGDLASEGGNHEDAQRFYGLAVKCDRSDGRQFSHLNKFAQAMSAAGNHAESVEICKNILEELPPGDPLRAEIERELGKTLVKLGFNIEALQHLEDALRFPLNDRERFEVREEILALKTVEGLCDEAISMGDEQRELALHFSDREQLALVETDVGIAQFYKGALPESHESFKKAHRIYKESGNKEKMMVSLNNMGNVLSAMGETRSALASWQEALDLAGDHAVRHDRGQILNNMGIAYYKLREFDEARAHYAEARGTFDELKSKSGLAFSLTNLGEVEYAEGNYEPATECWATTLDLYREMQDSLGVGQTLLQLAQVYVTVGQTPRLAEVLEETAVTITRHKLDSLVPFHSYLEGQRHFLAGDHRGSLEAYRQSGELFVTTAEAFTGGSETPGDRIIQLAFRRAEVHRAMGDHREALRALETGIGGDEGGKITQLSPSLQAEYAYNLGLIALQASKAPTPGALPPETAPLGALTVAAVPPGKPITHFLRGIALIEHEHVTELTWKLSLALGNEYLKRGHREKAREWLGNASAIVGHFASTFSSPELRDLYLSSEGRRDVATPAVMHDCSLQGSDAS